MEELRFKYQQAAALIKRHGRLTIVIHRKPDGDAIGAASAFMGWARQLGVGVTAFCHDALPKQYDFLAHAHEFTRDHGVFADDGCALVGVFDAGDLRYAGIADTLDRLPRRPTLLNFDHHADNEQFGQVNLTSGRASSTCEVILGFLKAIGATITPSMATALLTGLMFDTQSLSNPMASVSAMRAASELLRLGGTRRLYEERIMRSKSVPSLRVWGKAMERLRANEDLGVISTALMDEDMSVSGVEHEHVEGISNFLDGVLDAKATLFLKELPDGRVKGGFRTVDDLDVSIPARLVGGGGHRKAAGFTVDGVIHDTGHGWRIGKKGGDSGQGKGKSDS
jgi:phosphoesterase RecJ-like protein